MDAPALLALGTIIGAIATAIVKLRHSSDLAKQSEVDRLQDVLDYYHAEVGVLIERVLRLEQNAANDAREKSQLQQQVEDLKRELIEVRSAWEKERSAWDRERAAWVVERAGFEERIAALEQRLERGGD